MNKIRTTVITAALAGGSILGLASVTGIADAAVDTDATSETDTATPTAAVAAAQVDQTDTEADAQVDPDRAARRAARQEARQANRQEVADVLGVSVEDLAEQLQAGATLADVAEANGVAVSAVVDVIVQNKTDRIDLAVESERITAEEAAERIAGLDERVQTRVEEGRPERGEGEGRRGPRGQRGVDADATAEAPAPDTEG